MQHLNRRQFLESSLLAAGTLLVMPRGSFAASVPGVETVVAPLISGEERNAQPDIWALEVNYKPVRMIVADLPESPTAKAGKQLVWYLAYRAIVRKSSGVPETTDKPEDRPIFVPEFTLVVDGKNGPDIYQDRVLPAAQVAINRRERHKYKNSVEIVGQLPKVTPDRAKIQTSVDGVATWVGIDPDTVFFTVYMSGFSNGYKVTAGPNGEEVVTRRTLMQKFWRPGDRFDQNEEEIRLKDEPQWIYR